jgi:hypothetical protein
MDFCNATEKYYYTQGSAIITSISNPRTQILVDKDILDLPEKTMMVFVKLFVKWFAFLPPSPPIPTGYSLHGS